MRAAGQRAIAGTHGGLGAILQMLSIDTVSASSRLSNQDLDKLAFKFEFAVNPDNAAALEPFYVFDAIADTKFHKSRYSPVGGHADAMER